MTQSLPYLLSALSGAAVCYLAVRPKLAQLKRLTDRDERGRFVRREGR